METVVDVACTCFYTTYYYSNPATVSHIPLGEYIDELQPRARCTCLDMHVRAHQTLIDSVYHRLPELARSETKQK